MPLKALATILLIIIFSIVLKKVLALFLSKKLPEPFDQATVDMTLIDEQISAIQKSTKVNILFLSPIHEYFRGRFRWYYNWHIKSFATKIHIATLLFYVSVTASAVAINILKNDPAPVQAAAVLVGNSSSSYATSGSSFRQSQRRTFYDTVNLQNWAFYYNGGGISAYHSTDGSTWITTISGLSYNTSNFSVAYKEISGTGYVFVAAECNSYDICLKRGTLSSDSIAWGSEVTIFDGTSSTDIYNRPSVTLDNSASSYVWVAAVKTDDSSALHEQAHLRRSVNAGDGDLSSWGTQIKVGMASADLNDIILLPQVGENIAMVQNGSSQNITTYLYDGSTWSEAKGGGDYSWFAFGSQTKNISGTVYAIQFFNSELYVGGNFVNAGGVTGRNYIAKWNGTDWETVGSLNDLSGIVYALTVSGTDLYVGGGFSNVGGVAERDFIARWDGSSWNTVCASGDTVADLNSFVTAIAVSGSNVYVGGAFTNVNDVAERDYIAYFDGTSWNTLTASGDTTADINSTVRAIAISGSDIYIGGAFSNVNGVSGLNGIARFDGSSWNLVGAAGDMVAGSSTVYSLAIVGSDLYVGGNFANVAGAAERDCIARFDGVAWNSVTAAGDTTTDLGSNPTCTVSTIIPNGSDIYIGGSFVDVNGVTTRDAIARWDGSAWNTVGGDTAAINNGINAIVFNEDEMYAGGAATFFGLQSYSIGIWRQTAVASTSLPATSQISAVTDSTGNIYLVYQDANNDLSYRKYTLATSTWGDVASVYAGTISYPSLTINQAKGDLFAFWVESNAISYKKFTSSTDSWDLSGTQLYNTGTNRGLIAPYKTANGTVPVMWTNGTVNPFKVYYDNSIQSPDFNTRYWVNQTTGNWSDTANWSETSGGTGGATVPTTGEAAVFDGVNSSNGNVVFDTNVDLKALDFQSGYSGTITQSSYTITTTTTLNLIGSSLTASAAISSAGTFSLGSSQVLDLNGNNFSVTGAFSNDGTLKLTGDETAVSLTNDIDSGTVEYTATSGSRNIKTLTYYNLTINGTGGIFSLPTTITVNGDLALMTGTLNLNGNTLNLSGSWLNTGGICSPQSGTVNFVSATSGRLITTNNQSFGSLNINNSGGSWTLQDNLIADSINLTNGNLIDNGKTVTVNGNIFISNLANLLISTGTWIHGASGTITNQNSSNYFKNLTIAGSGVITTLASNIYVGSDSGIGGTVTMGPGTLTATNYILNLSADTNDALTVNNLNASSSLQRLNYTVLANSTLTQKEILTPAGFINSMVHFINLADSTLTATGDWNFGTSYVIFGSPLTTYSSNRYVDMSTYNLTAGTLSLGYSIDGVGYLKLGSGTHSFTAIYYQGGTTSTNALDFGSSSISVAGNIDFTQLNVTPGTSSLTLAPIAFIGTITSAGQSFNNIVMNSIGGGWTLQDDLIAKNITLTTGNLKDNAKNVTINGNISVANTAGLLTSTGTWVHGATGSISNPNINNWFKNLTIAGSGVTTTLSSSINVGYDSMVGGTITMGPGILNGAGYSINLNTTTSDALTVNNLQIGSSLDIFAYKVATSSDLTQKAIALPDNFASSYLYIRMNSSGNLTATGHFNLGNNPVRLDSGTTALPLKSFNMNGFNLTSGDFNLGNNSPNNAANLKLGSGNHSLGNFKRTTGSTNSNNLVDLASSNVSISEAVDFSGISLTAGTSTLILTSTDTQTFNSASQTINNLSHTGSGTTQLTSAINIDGNFLNSAGTFDANGQNINVAKDWTVSGGAFSAGSTPGSQTVNFDSTNTSILSGSTTFNNLVMDASTDGAKTIQFEAGATQTILSGKTWTLNGADGKILTLRSTSDTNPWYFNIAADFTAGSYVDVKDSQNISNLYRITSGPNTTDSGNNVPGWIFNSSPAAPSSLGPAAFVDGDWQDDLTPTLEFILFDTNSSDQLYYQIQIATTSTFSSGLVVDYQSSLGDQGARSFTLGQDPSGGTYTVGSVGQSLSDGIYFWRIKSFDQLNSSSDWSVSGQAAIADIKIDNAAPSAPQNLEATLGNGSISLTWDNPSDTDLSCVAIFRSESSGFIPDLGVNKIGNTIASDTETFTDLTAQNGKTYYYKVKAVDNADNYSLPSNEASAKPDADLPATPKNLNVKHKTNTKDGVDYINKKNVIVTFDRSEDLGSGLNNYHLFIGSSSTALDILNKKVLIPDLEDPDKPAINHLFTKDGRYYLRLQAEDNQGNLSSFSQELILVVDTVAPIFENQTLTITDSSSETAPLVTMTWVSASDQTSGILGYKITKNSEESEVNQEGVSGNIAELENHTLSYTDKIDTENKNSYSVIAVDLAKNESTPISGEITIAHNDQDSSNNRQNQDSNSQNNSDADDNITFTQAFIGRVLSVFENFNIVISDITNISEKKLPIVASIIALIVSAASASIAPLANNLTLISFPEYVRSLLYSIFSLSSRRKRKEWGKVLEAGSGVPIPQAKINLVKIEHSELGDNATKKMVASTYSSKDGSYAFLADPGQYRLTIEKDMYLVSKIPGYYYNEIINVRNEKDSLIIPTILLNMDETEAEKRFAILHKLNILDKVIFYLSLTFLIFGTFVTISSLIQYPRNLFFIAISFLYLFLWIITIKSFLRVSPIGKVQDVDNKQGVPLALIRIMDKYGIKLVKTAVSNENGKYKTLIDKGEYRVLAAKLGYKQIVPIELDARKNINTINHTIEVKKD